MKRILAFVLVLVLTVSLTACGGSTASSTQTAAPASSQSTAASAQSYVLKFALQNGENHPLCQSVAKFGELLDEKTDGRITLDLYYSAALGDKATTVQGMQTGTIDGAMLMSGVIADYGCDDLRVFTLPYLFDSVAHARAFEKSEEGKALLDTVQSSGSKMICVGTYQESARNYFFKEKEVRTPADMKNLQIRCQEGSVYYDSVEALGAYAESVAFSELYSALQSGVVDGAEQPLSGFVNNSFQEISKYYVMDQHEISPNLILFSEITWNKLSDEDKAIITEAFNESVSFFEELSDAKDKDYLQTIKDSGVEVIDVNVAEWQEACVKLI
ncbi:MAG: TRAP transporter substrate-binding protein [Oscillospiraceae bacterium]|nr:TRAP transporter substrate-binding protein [Oscillospiraceae bacterium]